MEIDCPRCICDLPLILLSYSNYHNIIVISSHINVFSVKEKAENENLWLEENLVVMRTTRSQILVVLAHRGQADFTALLDCIYESMVSFVSRRYMRVVNGSGLFVRISTFT